MRAERPQKTLCRFAKDRGVPSVRLEPRHDVRDMRRMRLGLGRDARNMRRTWTQELVEALADWLRTVAERL